MASRSLADDRGLFGPDSMVWRVNRESVVTLGGTCALLMQLAHPQVAAGVRDHSQFQEDTPGRLRRTLDLTTAIAFGSRDVAMRAVQVINARHRAVNGPGYSATDPNLLMWVHATLVYSGIRAYRAFVGPLSAIEADQFYQDTKLIGGLLGVPPELYPDHVDGFERYLQEMIDSGEVVVGEDARRMSDAILRPGFRGVPRIVFAPLSVITAGLLPPALREGYALNWGRVERALFAACHRSVPRLLSIAPSPIRVMPHARNAERRLHVA